MDRNLPATHLATQALHALRSVPPLTSVNVPVHTAVQPVFSTVMQLPARDYAVLLLVSRFDQLTTAQIALLVFHESTTRGPCDRVLKRLLKANLLELVLNPHPVGRLGGSTMNVYQLGSEGWPLFYKGRRKVAKIVRFHALAVADVFVAVKQAEGDGWLNILEWQTEPDCWEQVAGADLRPDLFLDLGLSEKRERLHLWIEVDLGGERQKQIIEKLERYIYAYNNADSYPRDTFPQILFLATSDDRVRELKQIVGRTPNLPEGLVTVAHIRSFPNSIR